MKLSTGVLIVAIIAASCQRRQSSVEPPPKKTNNGGTTSGGTTSGDPQGGMNGGGQTGGGQQQETVYVKGMVEPNQVRLRFGSTAFAQLTYRFYAQGSSSLSSGTLPDSGRLDELKLPSGTYDFYLEISNPGGTQRAFGRVTGQPISRMSDSVSFLTLENGPSPVPPPNGGGGGGSGGGGNIGGGSGGGGNIGGGSGGGGNNAGGTDININILFGGWKGTTDEGNAYWKIR